MKGPNEIPKELSQSERDELADIKKTVETVEDNVQKLSSFSRKRSDEAILAVRGIKSELDKILRDLSLRWEAGPIKGMIRAIEEQLDDVLRAISYQERRERSESEQEGVNKDIERVNHYLQGIPKEISRQRRDEDHQFKCLLDRLEDDLQTRDTVSYQTCKPVSVVMPQSCHHADFRGSRNAWERAADHAKTAGWRVRTEEVEHSESFAVKSHQCFVVHISRPSTPGLRTHIADGESRFGLLEVDD